MTNSIKSFGHDPHIYYKYRWSISSKFSITSEASSSEVTENLSSVQFGIYQSHNGVLSLCHFPMMVNQLHFGCVFNKINIIL